MINAIEIIANAAIKLENEFAWGTPLADISVKKIHYITLVKEMEFPTITQLAKTLKVTKPTVTNTVSKLIHQGFINKKQDRKDRRIFHLFLTEKGESIYTKKKQASRYFAEKVFSCLDDQELKVIIDILNKVLLNIQSQNVFNLTDNQPGDQPDE
ncbi:MAG: hypothetical protein APR63_03660 [Desulfuromonas sp. SDB]|nr:MAG: hypothetical protein APR63_03660 [Desulfuromonas sp. SDB]